MGKIINHTQLIQSLIDKYGLTSYCEIGVQSTAQNFDKIKCDRKVGVDPAVFDGIIYQCTSDYYFDNYNEVFDVYFLDGLHHKEQIKKDFENALSRLSDHGFIVIHDVLPENEQGTRVPRETKQWWGDVYKWAMQANVYGYKYTTFNIDNGCMVFTKQQAAYEVPSVECNWQNYLTYGRQLMNVTDEVTI